MKSFLIGGILLSLFGFVWMGTDVNPKLSRIWGPGLTPDTIIMPARYFFVSLIDHKNNTIGHSVGKSLIATIDGGTKTKNPCRIRTNVLDIKDGSYIIRYKLYETCSYLKINVVYEGEHLGESPYIINNPVPSDDCICPAENLDKLMNQWDCGTVPSLIKEKLDVFGEIDWTIQRNGLIETFNKPYSVSICHYVIKNNKIHRKCYGKHVGFNMFVDNILLSLSRKSILPDIEFFTNLGDWPLSTHDLRNKYPILSWCGSTESYDIIMPTYDITESTLENMGRVTLDILSVQGNTKGPYETRTPKLFWRGRDSNKFRLELVKLSRKNPDLFNVSLTNFFFYRDEEEVYGPKTEHVSFFSFFDYKYQLAIDGTVAPYRMPYLLAGGSVVFKPESKYFEHFYKNLEPNVHYVPVKQNISDLVEKIKWAIENDEQARKIARNAQKFANDNVLPKDIFCYHFHLLNELNKIITSPVEVLEDMEQIEQKTVQNCDCSKVNKDEL
nr:KDEL motif-containing protein 1-like [Leptinotarsa decemlineata]